MLRSQNYRKGSYLLYHLNLWCTWARFTKVNLIFLKTEQGPGNECPLLHVPKTHVPVAQVQALNVGLAKGNSPQISTHYLSQVGTTFLPEGKLPILGHCAQKGCWKALSAPPADEALGQNDSHKRFSQGSPRSSVYPLLWKSC